LLVLFLVLFGIKSFARIYDTNKNAKLHFPYSLNMAETCGNSSHPRNENTRKTTTITTNINAMRLTTKNNKLLKYLLIGKVNKYRRKRKSNL